MVDIEEYFTCSEGENDIKFYSCEENSDSELINRFDSLHMSTNDNEGTSAPIPSKKTRLEDKKAHFYQPYITLPEPIEYGDPLHKLTLIPHVNLCPPCTSTSTFLVQIKELSETSNSCLCPTPFPKEYKDKWSHNFVRMPCSPQNVFPVNKKLVNRWQLINESLSSNISNAADFVKCTSVYNPSYSSIKNLHLLFDSEEASKSFYSNLLPAIIHLALALPEIVTQSVPMLVKGKQHDITMSQQQVACLLANAFLGTYPRRNKSNGEYSNYNFINFNGLLSSGSSSSIFQPRKANKLKCILSYFERILLDGMPTGVITFYRRVLSPEDTPNWLSLKDIHFSRCHISSEGLIEERDHALQVDFANSFIGGGVLNTGCVQEEIRFVICPELLVSLLFSERMDANEAIVIVGSERFCSYTGYADTFQFSRPFFDQVMCDSWGRKCTVVTAIDAISYSYGRTKQQYQQHAIERDLKKAYIGFKPLEDGNKTAVATGNWGCGAFKGDPLLKFLIQWMAASVAGRDVIYYTFGDAVLTENLGIIYKYIREFNCSISNVFLIIQNFYNNYPQKQDRTHFRDYVLNEDTWSFNWDEFDNDEDFKANTP